jgi:hypothetical protein
VNKQTSSNTINNHNKHFCHFRNHQTIKEQKKIKDITILIDRIRLAISPRNWQKSTQKGDKKGDVKPSSL